MIAAIGAVLAAGGLWLVLLGGSLYYLMSGIGYVVVGVLLWRRRSAGAVLAVALLAATLGWALWEAGLDYWALFPRVLLPAGLALLALLAALRFPANESRRVTASVAGALALAIAVEVAFAFVPHGVVQNAPSRAFVLAEKSEEPSDWSSYGRTAAGTRYSPFTQINRENVGELKPVWTFRSGDDGPGMEQNTPLQIGDHVYTCSRNGRLAALDADTGAVRWRYDFGERTCLLVALPRSRLLRAAGRAARGDGRLGLRAPDLSLNDRRASDRPRRLDRSAVPGFRQRRRRRSQARHGIRRAGVLLPIFRTRRRTRSDHRRRLRAR